uniref:Fimbrillin family protein n=1 Tax=Prevotella sp. GTC17260 TaxID=3236796 RepID=A0AB33JFM1_9BACT
MNSSMNTKNIKIVLAFLGGLAASACTTDDTIENRKETSKKFEIELSVALQQSADGKKSASRVVTSEDTKEGLKTEWKSGDQIKVAYYVDRTMKLATMTAKEVKAQKALFKGNVETSMDAEAFKKSKLYAVNDSETDKITTEITTDNKLKVNVDFDGQDGSATNISKYNLLFAEGTADKTLEFKYQTSVLKLTFTTDKLNEKPTSIDELKFTYTAKESTINSLFADKATLIATDSKDVTYNGITFFKLSNLASKFANNKTTHYIAIPANASLTGELAIQIKCNDHKTYRKTGKMTAKTFLGNKVMGKVYALKEENRVPNITDYLYSDGSWGPLVYDHSKVPVAVVFSNHTTESDRKKGFTHGYAIALKDARWPTPWATEIKDYPESPNIFEHPSAFASQTLMQNLEGYTINKALYDNHLKNKDAAIAHAIEYGTENWRYNFNEVCLVPAPQHTSGWFLPTMGQWYMLFTNLAELNPNKIRTKMGTDNKPTSFYWQFSSSEEKEKALKKFEEFFSWNQLYNNGILYQYYNERRIPYTGFYLPTANQIDWYLWAADEAKDGGQYGCAVKITPTTIEFTYIPKNNGSIENNGYAARAIIAF